MRTDRLSMEGMISNANHVLEQAMNPKQKGLFRSLFRKCKGVCIFSAVEAGFVFSGQMGSGILMKKLEDGSWSPPCAMGFSGMGWGFLAGAAQKEIIVFIFDKNSMEGMLGETGIRIGGQINLTLGPFGRNYEDGIGISNKGALYTGSVAFSKGAFAGLSIEGAFVGPREGVNDNFYGEVTTTRGIVNGQVEMPSNKPTVINEVYEKLAVLQAPKPKPVDEDQEVLAELIVEQTARQPSEDMLADPSGEMKKSRRDTKRGSTQPSDELSLPLSEADDIICSVNSMKSHVQQGMPIQSDIAVA